MSAHDRLMTAPELAKALGLALRTVQVRAQREAWPTTDDPGHSQRKLFKFSDLPPTVQAEIIQREETVAAAIAKHEASVADAARMESDEQRAAVWLAYEQAKGWQKRAAGERVDALVMLERLAAEGQSFRRARVKVADHYTAQGVRRCSVRTLERWEQTVRDKPRCDWLAYLLPAGKKPRSSCDIPEAAWLVFLADYLRVEQPSAASCYRRLQQQAKANRAWGVLPSLDTFMRRLAVEVSASQIALRREGEEAMMALGPKIERSRAGLAVMERVNADGHKFDVAVAWPDSSIARPMIVGWQDIASGKLLGWRVGKTETSDLVRLSFCDMVKSYGIPAHAYLDNGRAFASKKNTGGLATRYRYKVKAEDPEGVITRLGTQVHWVTPYNGKAKPVERMWRDFAQDIAKRPEFAGAYLGNSPSAKPENYGSRAIPYEDFMRVLAEAVAEHNARPGRRASRCAGRSFDDTFAEGYAAATIKRATKQQLSLLLLASEVVKVSGKTADVTLAGNRYWGECLIPHMREKIELRFDPENLHATVHAVALDGSYIGEVPCTAPLGWESGDREREAIKAQAEWRKAHKRERAAAQRVEAAHGAKDAMPPVPVGVPSPAAVAMFVPKNKKAAPRAVAANESGPGYDPDLIRALAEKQGIRGFNW